MSGSLFLDWAATAVSLANAVLLLWLGLTVLLNAERRTWGVWLAGGGLLAGGGFFVAHSIIVGQPFPVAVARADLWWLVGWLVIIALPAGWYVMMLWYAGFWEGRGTSLYRRHRAWLATAVVLGAILLALVPLTQPGPDDGPAVKRLMGTGPALAGVPAILLVYAVFITLCIALAIDALRRPGPTARVMGEQARARARPWLMAASGSLFAVSLVVAGSIAFIVINGRRLAAIGVVGDAALTVAWLDLIIASLIGLSVLLIGQAVVGYEVFTGRILPRRGFVRHWRRAVILAAGYGAAVGWALVRQLPPAYSLVLTVLLMSVFYALLSWRSYAQRERDFERLRPFVASQRLYEHVVAPSAPSSVDTMTPFRALCGDVLDVSAARLEALGPAALLAGPPLDYPNTDAAALSLPADVARDAAPEDLAMPLDPVLHSGAVWAVPLWGERGLIGAMVLGEKRSGGVYAQEEIEIARAVGERLIDTQASAEMARRLMTLERQHLTESHITAWRPRRVLHDDVLPKLHAAMLNLSDEDDAVALLADIHCQVSDLLREMPVEPAPLVAELGLVGALRRSVGGEFTRAFDGVAWHVDEGAERMARRLSPLAAEAVFHAAREAVRNSARHARGGDLGRSLRLQLAVGARPGPGGLEGCELRIVVQDDGVGLGAALDTDSPGGRGLALHGTMMAVLGGELTAENAADGGACVTLTLPVPVGTEKLGG